MGHILNAFLFIINVSAWLQSNTVRCFFKLCVYTVFINYYVTLSPRYLHVGDVPIVIIFLLYCFSFFRFFHSGNMNYYILVLVII